MNSNINTYPFHSKKKGNPYSPLIVVVCIALLLAVCILPFPVRTTMNMKGAEMFEDGTMQDIGDIYLDITIHYYLLRPDEAVVNDIKIQNLDASVHADSNHLHQISYPISIEGTHVHFKKGREPYALSGYLYFKLDDPGFAILKTDGRLFVGSMSPSPDFQGILEEYEVLNFWGMHY